MAGCRKINEALLFFFFHWEIHVGMAYYLLEWTLDHFFMAGCRIGFQLCITKLEGEQGQWCRPRALAQLVLLGCFFFCAGYNDLQIIILVVVNARPRCDKGRVADAPD